MSATVNTTASCPPSDGGGDVDMATVKEEKASVRDDFETSAGNACISHWSCLHLALCNGIFKSYLMKTAWTLLLRKVCEAD